MPYFFRYKQTSFYRKVISLALVLSFSLFAIVQPVGSQGLPSIQGSGTTAVYAPAVLRGMTVHPENPMAFDFIVDRGQEMIADDLLKDESLVLIKYFLASMTIPDKDAWVNLSPTEEDRIIPEALGQTEMGRQMLEQDYALKQLAASLTNPDTELGKQYWKEVRRLETLDAERVTLENQQNISPPLMGGGDSHSIQSLSLVKEEAGGVLPISDQLLNPNPQPLTSNYLNKVWIMPDTATVVEKDGFAYITESTLKVVLGEDDQVTTGATEGKQSSPVLSSPKVSPNLSSPKVFIGDPQTANRFPLKTRGNDSGDNIVLSSDLETPSLVKEGAGEVLSSSVQRPTTNVQSVEPLTPNHQSPTTSISTQVFRQLILPKLIEEVNTGKSFAPTRQVYQSVILAAWYKKALKDSLLGRIYADQSKVAGIETDVKDIKQKVYEQYLAAFKKGAYSIIKEESGPDGEMIPRKYFSGGHIMSVDNLKVVSSWSAVRDIAQRIRSIPGDQLALVSASTVETGTGVEQVVVGSRGVGQGQVQGDRIFLSGWDQGHVPEIFQPDLRAAVYETTHIEIENFSRQHLDGDQTPYILDFYHTPTSRSKLAQVTHILTHGNKEEIIDDILGAFLKRTHIEFSQRELSAIRSTIGLLAEQIKDYNTPQEVRLDNGGMIKYYRFTAASQEDTPFVTEIIEKLIAQEFDGDDLPAVAQEVIVERIVTGGLENQVDLITFSDGQQYIVKLTGKHEDEYDVPNPYLKNQKEILERLHAGQVDSRIARLVLYGSQSRYDYLVENYLPGERLSDVIQTQGVFSLKATLNFAVNFTKAVGFVHSRGVIVRDLIPTNINVDNNGNVYLFDFDVSSTDDYDWDKDAYRISNTVIHPRIDYSDEGNQIEAKESDAQLDIVYIGQAIYFAATGNILPKKTADISADKIDNQELLGIIQRTIAPRDNGRYKNVDELLTDLLALQEKPNISSSSSIVPLGEHQGLEYEEYLLNKKHLALANGVHQEVIDQHQFLTLAESRKLRDYFVNREDSVEDRQVVSGVIDLLNTPGKKIVLDVGPGEHSRFVHALADKPEFGVIGVGVDEIATRVRNNAFLLNGDISDVLQSFPNGTFDLISMFNPETIWDSDKTSTGPDEIFFSLIESKVVQSKIKINGRIVIKPFWNATAEGIQRLQANGYPFREISEREFKGAMFKDDEIVEQYDNLSGYADNRKDNFFVLDIVAASAAIDELPSQRPVRFNSEQEMMEYIQVVYRNDIEKKKIAAKDRGISEDVIENHRFLSFVEARKIKSYFIRSGQNYRGNILDNVVDALNTPGLRVILDIGPGVDAYFVKAMAGTGQFAVIGVGIDERAMEIAENAFLLHGDVKDVLQSFPDEVFDAITLLNPDRNGWDPQHGPDVIFKDLVKAGIVSSKIKANGRIIIKPFWSESFWGVQHLIESGFNFQEMSQSAFRELFNLGNQRIEGNNVGVSETYNFFVWQKLQLPAGLEVVSAPTVASTPTIVGGIDFDASKLNLQIKRDGRGVPLPLPQQDLENINIEGLFPVIINIMPVNAQTLPILGQVGDEEDERRAKRVESFADERRAKRVESFADMAFSKNEEFF